MRRFDAQLKEFLSDLGKRDANMVAEHHAETQQAWDKAKATLTPVLQQTCDALKKTGRQASMANGDDIGLTLQLYGKSSLRVFEFSPVSDKHRPARLIVSEGNKMLFEHELEKLSNGVAETLVLKLLIHLAYNQRL